MPLIGSECSAALPFELLVQAAGAAISISDRDQSTRSLTEARHTDLLRADTVHIER